MPDHRKHRGPHPEDGRLFDRSNWEQMQLAVQHLSWLLTHEYPVVGALKLVGDRFRLNARQRLAVRRSACSDQALRRRDSLRVDSAHLAGSHLSIDGFNLLTTIEAALAGGVLLRGRDGCLRDMASMHGSYRKVEETIPALQATGRFLESQPPETCVWWLDKPVSNSGRISQIIQQVAALEGWPWQTRLVLDPDYELQRTTDLVASADSVVLDNCQAWTNLAAEIVDRVAPQAWVVPLGWTGIAK